MAISIQALIDDEFQKRDPTGWRAREKALLAARDNPNEQVDPRLATHEEVLALTERVLADYAPIGKSMSAEEMLKAGYPTAFLELAWPPGNLANRVTEDGWERSMRTTIDEWLAQRNIKRPGDWRVAAHERTRRAETATTVMIVPGKDGARPVEIDGQVAYATVGINVLFVDVSNSPAPVYDGHGAITTESAQKITVAMPPEFAEAMAAVTAATKKAAPDVAVVATAPAVTTPPAAATPPATGSVPPATKR